MKRKKVTLTMLIVGVVMFSATFGPFLSNIHAEENVSSGIVINESENIGEEDSWKEGTIVEKGKSIDDDAGEISEVNEAESANDISELNDLQNSDDLSGICGAEGNESNVVWKLIPNNGGDGTYTLDISGTGAMADVTYNWGDIDSAPWASKRSQITGVQIGQGITKIGKYSFIKTNITGSLDLSGCTNLTQIGERAFSICGIEKLVLPSSVVQIDNAAFSGNEDLSAVDFNLCYNLKILSSESFSYCNALQEVDLSGCTKLETIGNSCFTGCKTLDDVIFPENIKTIGNSVFSRTGFTTFSISGLNHLTSIGYQLVAETNKLEELHIRDCPSLKEIGTNICVNSPNLHTVVITGCPEATLAESIFSSINSNSIVTVYTDCYFRTDYGATGAAHAHPNGGYFTKNTKFTNSELAVPVKDHAIFRGWYEDEQFAGNPVYKAEQRKLYYAKWEESSYEVLDRVDFGILEYGKLEPKDFTVTTMDGEANVISAESGNENIFMAKIDNTDNAKIIVTPVSDLTVGTYEEMLYVTTGDGAIHTVEVKLTVEKAVPEYTVPSDLTAKEGQTLKDIKLPAGFSWMDESQSVGKAGTHIFKAVYTPADTVNYEVVDGVEIRVRVYADADAGESGSTDGKDYTADNGKNITPSTGVSEYMWLWLGILALSGGTSGLMAWKKRKQL